MYHFSTRLFIKFNFSRKNFFDVNQVVTSKNKWIWLIENNENKQ